VCIFAFPFGNGVKPGRKGLFFKKIKVLKKHVNSMKNEDFSYHCTKFKASLAQLVEQLTCNQ
jgi:hypothetical protein